ncbi:hypothetical protein NNJEOMEG_00828 [Fundidesulfovibrio magnetotacticus]|uniref:Uncharacterized protein n=1 Tax=Fundidesulfovibrio magnetotacticus TaxID=2730080 RepID=A0A6V8LSC0_9BACT|nr:hypothetical protein [Fundidesulfovibrio magnetotacticus]GFK92999.1 hypothetical protein NNJEOMEG_00828 [Fundidesulfovibrio magnetotacticus]
MLGGKDGGTARLIGIEHDGEWIGAYVESEKGYALIRVDAGGGRRFQHIWNAQCFSERDAFASMIAKFAPNARLLETALPLQSLDGHYLWELLRAWADDLTPPL